MPVRNFSDGCPPARLTIHTTRGDFTEVVWHAKGSIEFRMSMDEIIEKYMSTKPFSARPVKEGAFEKIIELTKSMETLDNVNILLDAVNNAFEK